MKHKCGRQLIVSAYTKAFIPLAQSAKTEVFSADTLRR